jgi:hypothetical protein
MVALAVPPQRENEMRNLALSLVLAGFVSAPAAAHDKWWNGREVDPITKRVCCGDNDVTHLERTQVRVVPGGYQLLDTGELVTFDHTQPSTDGEFWVFRWGNPKQTQCFFAPTPAT